MPVDKVGMKGFVDRIADAKAKTELNDMGGENLVGFGRFCSYRNLECFANKGGRCAR